MSSTASSGWNHPCVPHHFMSNPEHFHDSARHLHDHVTTNGLKHQGGHEAAFIQGKTFSVTKVHPICTAFCVDVLTKKIMTSSGKSCGVDVADSVKGST